MCEKWLVIFVISKFFLLTDVLKWSAISDEHPLFATLLTPPMLITAFLHFWHEGHWEPCNDVGSLSPAKLLMGFELGMFWFWLQCLNLLGHSPQNIYIIWSHFMLVMAWFSRDLIRDYKSFQQQKLTKLGICTRSQYVLQIMITLF